MPGPAIRQLTLEERRALETDGVTCLRQVLPDEWLATICDGVSRITTEGSELGQRLSLPDRGFTSDLFMWLEHDQFRSLVFDSPLAALAQDALGSSSVTHWYDQLFVKEPGSDVPTPWHHDLTFWPIAGDQIVSFWIPLDPVTRESSGLEYVKGSHRWPNRYKAVTPDYNSYMVDPELEDVPDIDADRDRFDLVHWAMEPGDILAFHPLIVHGSSGNSSRTTRRRAVASRWVGDDVVYAPRRHTMPLPSHHGLEPGDRLSGPVFPTVSTG